MAHRKSPGISIGWAFAGLTLALVVVVVLAAGLGALPISPKGVIASLLAPLGLDLGGATSQESAVLWSIRLPRVALGALVGASLAVSGALMQGLFRNPLAEPGLLGVASGAAMATAGLMVMGGAWLAGLPPALAMTVLPIAAFVGGLLTVSAVHRAAVIQGRTAVTSLLLAGIAFNALGFAGLGLLQHFASDQQLRGLTFWLLGSLGGATWPLVGVAAPLLLAPVFFGPCLARDLDALQLGEAEATHLGIQVERLQRLAVALVALGVGAAVAAAGMIAFLGLVVPHLVRLALKGGASHRRLLPASALLGALLLVAADLMSRLLARPTELPVGVITTLTGVPFFLGLLLRARRSLGP